MPYSAIHHPFRIDAPTLNSATTLPGISELIVLSHFPGNIRLLAFSPVVFTHAYQLLGDAPQRFGEDLTLYLSTAKTFFEKADVVGGIDFTGFGNSDSRRRLSEDLGVAYASLFMVKVFGVKWETIAQIPSNMALSKKRPDFLSFTDAGEKYIYEAKGTTGLESIEKCMTRALGQVKNYPEQAQRKIAIVTYLCADSRFFPSASFVVDPPSMPESVPADEEIAKLLHLEKVLQFIGLSETAKKYIVALSRLLRGKLKAKLASEEIEDSEKLTALKQDLTATEGRERRLVGLEEIEINGIAYIGRYTSDKESGLKVFNGVAVSTLAHALRIEVDPNHSNHSKNLEIEESGSWISMFADGTVLKVSL